MRFRKKSSPTRPYQSIRYLIITADDFGASKNINEGIKIAADNKSITAISVLSNFTESLPDLKKIIENHPDIGVSVHMNIITGKPILDAEQLSSMVGTDGKFYSIDKLLPRINKVVPDELKKEIRAQILILEKYGIKIDNISDQFGVLSAYSPFFDILIELAKEFNLSVRSPVLASVKYPGVLSNSNMLKRGRRTVLKMAVRNPYKALRLKKYFCIKEMERKAQKSDELGILHPDLLIECFWGEPTASNLLHILENLPDCLSEIVLHLGTNTRQENYPGGLDLNYFKKREYELINVTSNYLKNYIRYLNIHTVNYSQLAELNKK